MIKTNNVIFITGGTSGIGLSLAKELALKNTVIICGRNEDKLKKINNEFPQINTIKCDITKDDDLLYTYNYIKTKFPKLNILVNNAGVQYSYDFLNDDNVFEKAKLELEINLLAPINITKLFLKLLMKNNPSVIVNVISPLSLVAKKNFPTYCASKAGLYLFSQSLSCYFHKTALKVVTVMPPLVDTHMAVGIDRKKMDPDRFAKKLIKCLATGKTEINIGKSKLIPLFRIFPNLTKKILNRSA